MIDKVFKFLFALAAGSIAAAISGALAIVIAASLRGAAPDGSILWGMKTFAGCFSIAGETLADARTGKNGRHALVGMLRQSVFGPHSPDDRRLSCTDAPVDA